MASRKSDAAAAPQPATKGAAVMVGKQKTTAVASPPDRRVFDDISNLGSNSKKIQLSQGVNRPSFGSQLVKYTQANALENKNAVASAPLTPESAASKWSSEATDGSTSSAWSSKKKLACSLTEMLEKLLVEDIDELDGENELAVVDYVEDIYTFYKASELESRPFDYMSQQPELNTKMRAIVTDWIIEVHATFELIPEILYLAVYVIDRYLSLQTVPRTELQLVGVVALRISCKYEEYWTPHVSDLVDLCGNIYSHQQILDMEKKILNKIEWNLTVPTPYAFLVRFVKASRCSDKELEHMVYFFGELALMEYRAATMLPSMVAASAVYAARLTLGTSPLWTETLKHHSGFDEPQLLDLAKILVSSHAAAAAADDDDDAKLKTVYYKYTADRFGGVALHQPAAFPAV